MDRVNVEKLYNIIDFYGLDGETVANLFIDWNGTQIITEDFLNDLENVEGYEID